MGSNIALPPSDYEEYFGDILNNEKALPVLIACLLNSILDGCGEVTWLIETLKTHADRIKFNKGIHPLSLKDMACERMISHYIVLVTLVETDSIRNYSGDLLYKTIIKYYKTLTSIVKSLHSAKDPPTNTFQALIDHIGGRLSPTVYGAVGDNDVQVETKGKKQSKGLHAQIVKEQKAIPNIIFEIEKFDGAVIKYSNQSKSSLMRNFKKSTARDWRIDFQKYTNQPARTEPAAVDERPKKKAKAESVNQDVPSKPKKTLPRKTPAKTARGKGKKSK